jgi:hypothetical protein
MTTDIPHGTVTGGWTAGRVVAVVVGSVLALVSLGLVGGGAALLWADQALRQDGYVTTGTATYLSAALIWVPVRMAGAR